MEHQDCPGEFMFSVVASILTQIWNFCSTELILTSISTAGIFVILFFVSRKMILLLTILCIKVMTKNKSTLLQINWDI